ncbi:MAG TPA: glycosyltransferase [Bryobacteraceae bacterium]|jgi:glycosyltransferase involved in cell wall biosynthesis|nr:glycosyltransferase [Bryobacteraceae bacterium]
MKVSSCRGHQAAMPLTGRTIVCLATQEWGAHWSVAQQVASRLAPENRVIYVEPFHPPFAWLRNKHRVLRQYRDSQFPQIREVQPGIIVYQPRFPYLPGNMRVPLAYGINGVLYRRELQSMMRKLEVEKPIFWAFFAQSLVVSTFGCDLFVYDCVDDWPSFFSVPVERSWVERVDLALTRRADIVFAGSQPLADKKAGQSKNIHVVNHAADVDHFLKASAPETIVPADIDKLPRPRIGFVGMIDSLRFDAGLIARLAQNPTYQIVIVGGFMNGAERLIPTLPNIHVLGMKSVPDLPGYIKGMDVCVMPYLVNETTRYIFPLKLFEYLASGKPIVATPIPAVQQHADFIYVGRTADEIAALVDEALHENPAEQARRQKHAAAHDWNAHIRRKAELVKGLTATIN